MATARPALSPEAAQARVVETWREGRLHTLDIARKHGVPEHEVCRAIAADQNARHRMRATGKAVRR